MDKPDDTELDALIATFKWDGKDGSDYGTDDAKEDREQLKQALLRWRRDSVRAMLPEKIPVAGRPYNILYSDFPEKELQQYLTVIVHNEAIDQINTTLDASVGTEG